MRRSDSLSEKRGAVGEILAKQSVFGLIFHFLETRSASIEIEREGKEVLFKSKQDGEGGRRGHKNLVWGGGVAGGGASSQLLLGDTFANNDPPEVQWDVTQ